MRDHTTEGLRPLLQKKVDSTRAGVSACTIMPELSQGGVMGLEPRQGMVGHIPGRPGERVINPDAPPLPEHG